MKILLFVFNLVAATASFGAETTSTNSSIYDIPLKTIDGKETTLAPYKGKVMLIVNTASKCGYTKQYQGLQALYDQYKDKGLVVLGFPSNDFLWQEPGTNAEIKKFCELRFKVTFPMFEKGRVKGEPQPLYAYLISHDPKVKNEDIDWNFEKFLVNKKGQIVARFKSKVTPESKEVADAVEAALK